MSGKPSRRKCRCCRKFFFPDYRNGHHQLFCSAAACRQASKVASQRRWRRTSFGSNYHRGEQEVWRVQQWRQANPGYWKKPKPTSKPPQPTDSQQIKPEQSSRNVPCSPLSTLQDFCLTQDPAFVGLISLVTGSTLQEDIAQTARNLLLRGQNILGLKIPGHPSPNTSAVL